MNINSVKSILNLVSLESGNIAGSAVNGYKRKEGFIDTNGNEPGSVGNDFSSRTNFSQGALISSRCS